MKGHGKRLRRILAGILLGVVVLVLLVTLRLGTIIKTAVNTAGPALLGVPVSVESVSVYPLRGEVNLRTLTIGNPGGYGSEYLFRLDRMRLELALADLFKGRTRFREIVIEGPHVWYDRKLARSNVGDLLETLEKLAPPEDSKAPPEERKQPAKPVVIDRLSMQEGTVGIRIGVGMKLPLPAVELKDIGKDGALMPVQVIRLILVNIFKGVLNVVAGAGELAVEGVKEVGSLAVDGVKGAGSLAVDGVKGAGSLAADGVKGAGKAVGGVVSGLGGLFKGESSPTNTPPAGS
ncbi:MAG: hypothetical protein GX571_04320 [Lentisphaerae bacterium]|jgi:hypothetical protein|nr:hypothetical protein [Lentisphaerota bacterium]